MGPAANLQMEPGRSSREPPLDYQRWTRIAFVVGSQSPCQGARTLGYSILPLLHERGRLLMSLWFVAITIPVQVATDGLHGSQYRHSFFVRRRALKRLGIFFLPVVQDPTSRAHRLYAPTKEPLRSFRQQDVQPSLTRVTTKPYLLCTNALRCASADSYCINAHHCCAYLRCGTCPPLLVVHTEIY